MTPEPSFSFASGGGTLFSQAEVRSLMEVEYQRARRYGFPVCCMALRPDRIEEIALFHGQESRAAVLQAVVDIVRRTIRAGDLLGYAEQDRLVLLLPHLPQASVRFLCERILKAARTLEFETGTSTHRTTLSIGVSHGDHPQAAQLAVMERVAMAGLEVAESGGGDRWIESELYDLEARRVAAPEPAPALPASTAGAAVMPDYRERLVGLVEGGEDLERATQILADEIVARAMEAVRPVGGETDVERELNLLKRRIAKLTQTLGVTERELEELRLFRSAVESRGEVELPRSERSSGTQDDLRKALMRTIFEANQDLRKRLGETPDQGAA
ncbi:MAG: diguanylate cyclase [Planctomycetes bacterium]|nr:diguanylate cyclase [Planctomycetota bacterium]